MTATEVAEKNGWVVGQLKEFRGQLGS